MLEAERSTIKVPTDVMCVESRLPGLWTATFLLCPSMTKRGSSCLVLRGLRTSGLQTSTRWGLLGTWPHSRSLPVMRLSHPQTIPILQSVEKLSSTKPVPGAKKVGDHSYKALMSLWGRHPPDFTLFQPLAFLLLHQHTFLAGFGHFYVLVLFYSESSSFRQPQWGCGQ